MRLRCVLMRLRRVGGVLLELPRVVLGVFYDTGYRYDGSKTPNNTLKPDGLKSPPP
jgi:hypothetical protein